VVIVVTATPQAEERLEIAAEPAAQGTALETTAVEAAAPEATTTAPQPLRAGILVQGRGSDIYYLTGAGVRQRLYDGETFSAFGFITADIVKVDQAALEAVPLAGDLTRLVQDQAGQLYWVADGQLWSVDGWKGIVSGDGYTGAPLSQIAPALQKSLGPARSFENGALLQHNGMVYYLYEGSFIPAAATLADQAHPIDIPSGVLAAYPLSDHPDQMPVKLNAGTEAANLREGPGLEYEIVTVVNRAESEPILATGQSADGQWLLVSYRDEQGWLAAHLAEPNLALGLLPTVKAVIEVKSEVPEAEPAAVVVEASTPEAVSVQPVYCTDTPIRGFGKVWGDHPEVQQSLSCPWGLEQGTRAAVQSFQYGLMVWLEADTTYGADPVYVFFADGTYQRFGDLGPADPEKMGQTPAGLAEVGDKFSKVYWEGTGSRVKERLGYATGAMQDSPGAFQQFNNGRMFWTGVLDQIFVVYDYFVYDNRGNYTQIKSWVAYEDEF
jgi:hypothetical protein